MLGPILNMPDKWFPERNERPGIYSRKYGTYFLSKHHAAVREVSAYISHKSIKIGVQYCIIMCFLRVQFTVFPLTTETWLGVTVVFVVIFVAMVGAFICTASGCGYKRYRKKPTNNAYVSLGNGSRESLRSVVIDGTNCYCVIVYVLWAWDGNAGVSLMGEPCGWHGDAGTSLMERAMWLAWECWGEAYGVN